MDDLVRETVDRVREPGSPENLALGQVTGTQVDAGASEAEVLRVLLNAGRLAIQEKVMENGYAALAASHDEEDRAHEAAMRSRGTRRRSRVGTGE
ncbi:hypothetical protein NX801_11560 [Streptomyces sp. LP05-1]|uniref:Uncharacterized protein n=1 Tax=Streptomyces pyxinae TaxID=2970734 RepID=A0ABT2CHV4_9ACTN|nr:hypothetical protein [Streptomyces sp. LP05-1]MCS0636286.1 hypothetical protein [Streptomyces sp. LP05-1]